MDSNGRSFYYESYTTFKTEKLQKYFPIQY